MTFGSVMGVLLTLGFESIAPTTAWSPYYKVHWEQTVTEQGPLLVVDVNNIPHPHEVTTLGELRIGDEVNIEIDVVARYLERLMTKSET